MKIIIQIPKSTFEKKWNQRKAKDTRNLTFLHIRKSPWSKKWSSTLMKRMCLHLALSWDQSMRMNQISKTSFSTQNRRPSEKSQNSAKTHPMNSIEWFKAISISKFNKKTCSWTVKKKPIRWIIILNLTKETKAGTMLRTLIKEATLSHMKSLKNTITLLRSANWFNYLLNLAKISQKE